MLQRRIPHYKNTVHVFKHPLYKKFDQHHKLAFTHSMAWWISVSAGNQRTGRSAGGHQDGDVDAQVAVFGEQRRRVGVERQTVALDDGLRHALVDAARRRLPAQAPLERRQLQPAQPPSSNMAARRTGGAVPVREHLGVLARPDQLHDGVEHLVPVALLLLLQHEHEVEAVAALHHHPVHGARQVHVRRQEHNVLACHVSTGHQINRAN